MRLIPLRRLPNQSFSVTLDGDQWGFLLKTVNGTTAASLTRGSAPVIEGARCVAGSFLIPCEYEEAGNFIFLTQDQQLPYYTEFGVTQSLVYVGAQELAQVRAPNAQRITAADFDPIASPPLRFAPRGYSQA